MIMIDWETLKIPYDWKDEINDGKNENVSKTGELRGAKTLSKVLVGPYGYSVNVRSGFNRSGEKILEVSGNPAMYLQGHNLFGQGDLLALNAVYLRDISDRLGHRCSQSEYFAWCKGEYTLSRLDLNISVHCGSRAAARALLQSFAASVSIPRVGRGTLIGNTLYYNKYAASF